MRIPRLRSFPIALVTLLTAAPAVAQREVPSFESVPATEVGMSAERLDAATRALQAHVDAGNIPGAVAAVVRDGKLVYLQAVGYRDVASSDPMPVDALFRVYSMTRPITALGVLMLHDEGLLDVTDPVQRHLAPFANQTVLRDPDSTDASANRPRAGDTTVAQLLTHTSGIGSRSSRLYREQSVHAWDRTLEQVVDGVASVPLFEDPGTRYRYGMSAEILGRVIEEASGMELEEFYRRRIFEPLGMADAVFFVDPERADRLAVVHRRDAEGRLQAMEMETIPVTEPRALKSSGVGLVTSTMDFLRYGQFLLRGGIAPGGERLLTPESAGMVARNAVPDALLPIGDDGYWAGSGWTLGGLAVVLDPAAYDHTVNEGEIWWDGSAGTRFWVDPTENMVTVVMAQVSPAGGNGFREEFKTLVYDAIEERQD